MTCVQQIKYVVKKANAFVLMEILTIVHFHGKIKDPVQETMVIILFPIKLMFSNKIVNFGVLANNAPVQIDQVIFKIFIIAPDF